MLTPTQLNYRLDCPMRHENGNCLPCGGFCLSVNNEICEALHNAYQDGYSHAPVVHGRWVIIPRLIGLIYRPQSKCSACGEVYHGYHLTDYKYCPNCGAKMDGGSK